MMRAALGRPPRPRPPPAPPHPPPARLNPLKRAPRGPRPTSDPVHGPELFIPEGPRRGWYAAVGWGPQPQPVLICGNWQLFQSVHDISTCNYQF